jgi:spore germination protein GerM
MTQPSQKSWGLTIVMILAAIALGGGLAWVVGQSRTTKSPISEATTSPSPVPTATPTRAQTSDSAVHGKTQTYWLKNQNNDATLIAKVVQPAAPVTSEAQALEMALTKLLAGSDDTNLTTTIPQGTTLLKVDLKSDGIHVDLSQAFTSGGGAESMKGRLGQVLYTATSLKPNANVWISVEGKPLDVLGGEGLVVDQPLTRKLFEKEYL